MKFVLPALLAALVAAALPALADPGRGHGGGGGRGGGEAHGGGYAPRGGGRWAGPGGPGGPPGDGRYGGGYPGVPPGPVYAAPPNARYGAPPYYGEGQAQARAGVRTGQIQTMGAIIGRLQRRGGRILDADLGQGPGGQPVYRVVWASPDGRRVDYIIDARTGAILQGY
jgi:hypothetical protein